VLCRPLFEKLELDVYWVLSTRFNPYLAVLVYFLTNDLSWPGSSYIFTTVGF